MSFLHAVPVTTSPFCPESWLAGFLQSCLPPLLGCELSEAQTQGCSHNLVLGEIPAPGTLPEHTPGASRMFC